MLSYYSFPLFITSVFTFTFGFFVFLRNPRNKVNLYFSLLASSVSLWCLGYGLLYSSGDPQEALFYARLGFAGVVFIPTFTYQFVVSFLNLRKRNQTIIFYTGSIFFLSIVPSSLFFNGVYKYPWGYYPKAGILYGVFISFFYLAFIICILDLGKIYRSLKQKSGSLILRNQVKYVFLAFCVASLSISDYLPNYHIQIYPFAYLAAAGWLAIMAYGTLKYRLMDINIIIRRTLIYSFVMASLTIIYLVTITLFAKLFEGVTGYQTVFSSAVAAFLITVGFQPLRKRVQTFVDTKFFRQYVDREEKLYELSREVITHTTPEDMAKALLNVLGESLHPKSAALYLQSRDGNHFNRILQTGSSLYPELMNEDNALPYYFIDHPQPFVQDLPSGISDLHDTRDQSRREDVA